ncbi:MAG: hypothetical protein ACI857_001061 [Arenicella sp.]|jgi:hypothetical protein
MKTLFTLLLNSLGSFSQVAVYDITFNMTTAMEMTRGDIYSGFDEETRQTARSKYLEASPRHAQTQECCLQLTLIL